MFSVYLPSTGVPVSYEGLQHGSHLLLILSNQYNAVNKMDQCGAPRDTEMIQISLRSIVCGREHKIHKIQSKRILFFQNELFSDPLFKL